MDFSEAISSRHPFSLSLSLFHIHGDSICFTWRINGAVVCVQRYANLFWFIFLFSLNFSCYTIHECRSKTLMLFTGAQPKQKRNKFKPETTDFWLTYSAGIRTYKNSHKIHVQVVHIVCARSHAMCICAPEGIPSFSARIINQLFIRNYFHILYRIYGNVSLLHCVFVSAIVVFVFLSVHSLTKLIMNKGSAEALCGMPSAAAVATKYLLWTWQSPTENCDNSGICRKISSVTKWTPRCCGLRLIFRWNHAEPICIPRFDEAMLLSVKFRSFHINNSFVVVAWLFDEFN